MHGCGNDYVYLDGVSTPAIVERIGSPKWTTLVRAMSDRHTGIGSDGVIVVCEPTPAAAAKGAMVRMRMFNADGSESEMCGNGVRCVAKFAHDRLGHTAKQIHVQTGAGIMPIQVRTQGGRVVAATVDMGVPREGLAANGVRRSELAWRGVGPHWGVERDGVVLVGVFVSMGNPHMVVFEPTDGRRNRTITPADVRAFDLARLGPVFETHPAFAKRMNVHVAGIESQRGRSARRIVMRTWERGAGMTMACGTGACAVVVAGVLTGRCGRDVDVELPGGELNIRWDAKSGHVFMTGEAVDVFEGEWPDTPPVPVPEQPTLRTRRLVLRAHEPGDAAQITKLCQDRLIAAHTLTLPHPYSFSHARSWIALSRAMFRDGKSADFVITHKDKVVGIIGLSINALHARAEIGYWIGKPFRGAGFATEAAEAMLAYGFDTLKLDRIHSCHFAKNPQSGRVLQKIGLTHEGTQPRHVVRLGTWHDVEMYGISRTQWRARSRSRKQKAVTR